MHEGDSTHDASNATADDSVGEKIKRPVSGYILFANEQRAKIYAENPKIRMVDAAKVRDGKEFSVE